MKRILIFLLCWPVMVACAKKPTKDTTPTVYFGSTWQQGQVGMLYVYPMPKNTAVTATLSSSLIKSPITIQLFPYPITPKKSILLGLFGLSVFLPAGSYDVSINGKNLEFSTSINILPQKYPETVVHMGDQGASVQRNQSPERAVQAKSFWHVLETINIENNFPIKSLVYPVEGDWHNSSTYGERRIFVYPDKKQTTDVHDGLDFSRIPIDSAVVSVADGKVVMAENRILTGNTVIIEHMPGVMSLYYHMHSLSTQVGDKVKQGQRIGGLGGTGFVTGPHLHFSLRINQNNVDPALFLGQNLIDIDSIKKEHNIK